MPHRRYAYNATPNLHSSILYVPSSQPSTDSIRSYCYTYKVPPELKTSLPVLLQSLQRTSKVLELYILTLSRLHTCKRVFGSSEIYASVSLCLYIAIPTTCRPDLYTSIVQRHYIYINPTGPYVFMPTMSLRL